MNTKDYSQRYFGGGDKKCSRLMHIFDITALDYSSSLDLVASGSTGKNP